MGLARTDTATQLADAPIPTNSSTNSRDSSQGLLKLNSKLGSSKKVRFSTADAEQPEDAPTEGAADDQLDARMETLLSSLRPPGADKAAGQSASDTLNQAPGTPRSVLHKVSCPMCYTSLTLLGAWKAFTTPLFDAWLELGKAHSLCIA